MKFLLLFLIFFNAESMSLKSGFVHGTFFGLIGSFGVILFRANHQMNKLRDRNRSQITKICNDALWNKQADRKCLLVNICNAYFQDEMYKNTNDPILHRMIGLLGIEYEGLQNEDLDLTNINQIRNNIVQITKQRNQLIPFCCFGISTFIAYNFFKNYKSKNI